MDPTIEEIRDGGLRVLAAGGPWAMLESAFNLLVDALRIGTSFDSKTPTPREMASRQGVVAVIPISGPIIKGMSTFERMFFGGTSPEMISAQLRAVVSNPDVKAVLLRIDSPGGSVHGIQELADEIYNLRGSKPIVAMADAMAASAAYWIASAADEVAITPSGDAGSIGVFAGHLDLSRALDKQGVKMTLVRAGKYKAEGNPYEPLSQEARDHLQARVDEYYDTFVHSVARGRGASPVAVRDGYGQGRLLSAKQSLNVGLVDRIATFDEMLSRLGAGQQSQQRRQGNFALAKGLITQIHRSRLLEIDGEPQRHRGPATPGSPEFKRALMAQKHRARSIAAD